MWLAVYFFIFNSFGIRKLPFSLSSKIFRVVNNSFPLPSFHPIGKIIVLNDTENSTPWWRIEEMKNYSSLPPPFLSLPPALCDDTEWPCRYKNSECSNDVIKKTRRWFFEFHNFPYHSSIHDHVRVINSSQESAQTRTNKNTEWKREMYNMKSFCK